MPRKFGGKNKDLIKFEVKISDKVWDKNHKRQGESTLSKKYDFFGKINKETSAMITLTK